MGLLQDLASGAAGVRLALPLGEVRYEDDLAADLVVPAARALWSLRRSGFVIDLREPQEPHLFRAQRREARRLFEGAFVPGDHPLGPPLTPRTADPGWCPLVELYRVEVPGGTALRLIRRVTYQPGDEVVSGALLIPVARGTIELMVSAKADMTGVRECALLARLGRQPTPAEIDDPALDAAQPGHPLSRVRAALDGLVTGAGLAVTAPPPPPPTGPVELPRARSRLLPPPRFLPFPDRPGDLAGTLTAFARVSGPGDGMPETFDVFWVDLGAPGTPDGPTLTRLARTLADGWTRQGMSEVRCEARPASHPRTSAGAATVRFRTPRDEAKTSYQRFFGVPGGAVRITIGTHPATPAAEVEAELDAAAASWEFLGARRADGDACGDGPVA